MNLSNLKLAFFCIVIAVAVVNTSAWAWGRRGHEIVCASAAYLVADQPKADFLKEHSFDLGYYCNVPDFIWKEPATYSPRGFNHYINLEIFDRAVRGTATVKNPYDLDRIAFDKAFPQVPISAGRVWWRVKEMDALLQQDREKLLKSDLAKDKRQESQGDWLVHAGALGHYLGDLSMPADARDRKSRPSN